MQEKYSTTEKDVYSMQEKVNEIASLNNTLVQLIQRPEVKSQLCPTFFFFFGIPYFKVYFAYLSR